MFLRASLKLGLDQAILTGAEGKDMTKNELENLLKMRMIFLGTMKMKINNKKLQHTMLGVLKTFWSAQK